MTPRELHEWTVYDRLEPIGGRRGDFQAALIATTIANVNRGKNRAPYNLRDFLMFIIKAPVPRSPKLAATQLAEFLRARRQPKKEET